MYKSFEKIYATSSFREIKQSISEPWCFTVYAQPLSFWTIRGAGLRELIISVNHTGFTRADKLQHMLPLCPPTLLLP